MNGLVDTGREEEGGTIEKVALTYIHYRVLNRQHRELSSAFCDNLDWWIWGVGGRFKTEEIYVYT